MKPCQASLGQPACQILWQCRAQTATVGLQSGACVHPTSPVRAISCSFGRMGIPRGVRRRCISELDVQNALGVVRCMWSGRPAALYVMARMSAGAIGQCAQSGHTDSRAAHRIRHNVGCANRTPDRRLPPACSIRTLLSSGDMPERSDCHLALPLVCVAIGRM